MPRSTPGDGFAGVLVVMDATATEPPSKAMTPKVTATVVVRDLPDMLLPFSPEYPETRGLQRILG